MDNVGWAEVGVCLCNRHSPSMAMGEEFAVGMRESFGWADLLDCFSAYFFLKVEESEVRERALVSQSFRTGLAISCPEE